MGNDATRVVLDTNVLVSAYLHGGLPAEVLWLVIKGQCLGVTSPQLLTELTRVLAVRFSILPESLEAFEYGIREDFLLVRPTVEFSICRDASDNRVLEAASAGDCQFIVTGDRDLLVLGEFQGIGIRTPAEFLKHYANAF